MEDSQRSERLSLLETSSPTWGLWRRRYHITSKCINSKAALVTLLWSFTINFIYMILYQPSNYYFVRGIPVLLLVYAGNSLTFCFYPLAGFLADIKCGRHKTITRSFIVVVVSACLFFLGSSIIAPLAYYVINGSSNDDNIGYFYIVTIVILPLYGFVFIVIFTVSSIMFSSNIIQFGVDQLQDSPAEHQSLYIFWYFWTYYMAALISQLGWSITIDFSIFSLLWGAGVGIVACSSLVVLLLSLTSLAKSNCGHKWFEIDRRRLNPCKPVYRVTKFARKHKVPIRRSAFTYCEDDIPSGLNLGKEKYGGPFTTEEVEDVKAFYGILKILLACGFAFLPYMASDPLIVMFAQHIYQSEPEVNMEYLVTLFIQDGLLSPLLAVVGIPMYIFLIRPFTYRNNPRLLKRIGLGIIILLTSLIYTAIIDTSFHIRNRDLGCMLTGFDDYSYSDKYQSLFYLLPTRILSAFSNVLIYTGLYEFICAQSPHSMKGLLIGLSFAVRGLFEVIAIAMTFPFFAYSVSFPSCGMLYYFVTIAIGVVAFAAFVGVAKKYKFRERDEPCHVHRYVEEYYSRTQPESGYDYYAEF